MWAGCIGRGGGWPSCRSRRRPAGATTSALALWAAVLLLPTLAQAQLCQENKVDVIFGTGIMDLRTAHKSPDGKFRPSYDNTFSLRSTCKLSGVGASRDPDHWRAQVYLCGTSPCNNTNLPKYTNAAGKDCSAGLLPGAGCTLEPSAPANYFRDNTTAALQYRTSYNTTIPNAWKGKTTYYYIKCFYLCGGNATSTQERAAASFTLDAPVPAPPPPAPPPSPPPPPPEAGFHGAATAFIESPLKDPLTGIIWAPPNNVVPVTATCRVAGEYALFAPDNWPAQLLICGDPPGSGSCLSTDYDPNVTLIRPGSVSYNGTVYTATYHFTLTNALIRDPITYRYLTCLYEDPKTGIAKRAGASVDVVRARPPPSPPPRPPPPSPRPPPPRPPPPPPPRPPPPSPRPPSPRPPPPPPPSPPPPPPPPPPPRPDKPEPRQPPPPPKREPTEAHGWGDPHFRGFDGSRFDYHGKPGTWKELIGSVSQEFSLTTQFSAGTRTPNTTFMRVFEFHSGTTTVRVVLEPPLRRQGMWRLSASANGRPVVKTIRMPKAIKITFVPSVQGRHGRVEIETDYVRTVIIQKWRPNRKEHADFLDINIAVTRRLRAPVSGLLAPSYNAALRKLGGTGAAAAALTVLRASGMG